MKTSTFAVAIIAAAAALTTACSQPVEKPVASDSANITEGEAHARAGHTDHSEMISDPIGGLLYGQYMSYEGPIAQLKLKLSEPVTFTRVDRAANGETRIVQGVWDLAHHKDSGQQVIRFYDGDFQPIDEYAYGVNGDVLTLTYDGSGTELWWSQPLRAPEGGRCSTTDRSLACAEDVGLECREDVCTKADSAGE